LPLTHGFQVSQNGNTLSQRGPNTGTRAACGPRTVFVRPANVFCMPDITQSHTS